MTEPDPNGERVLVLAPTGRDGAATVEVLRRGGYAAHACADIGALITSFDEGVGIVLVAEEGLLTQAVEALVAWVERQPPWSDLPFLMLTGDREAPRSAGSGSG